MTERKTRGVGLGVLALASSPALASAQEASDGVLDTDAILQTLNSQVAPWGMRIVGALVGLFAAWIIAGMVSRTVRRAGEGRLDATLVRFFSSFVRYLILIAAAISILGVFGVETSSFAALIAASGLAIGLAFEGTLGNFAAGVMLLIFRPFRVGDFVDAGGVMGTVEEIELFATSLKTPDNRKIIIPNKQIGASTITNFAAYPTRRVDVEVGCDYGARVDDCRDALEEAVQRCELRIEEPAHQVFLKGLGDSSVNWVCRVWCKSEDYWALHQELVRSIHGVLAEKEIGIPFPQMDVHLDGEVVDALRTR
ncbi:MAG: mechanosensitive ion channel [Myxococcales bacterium]|nr:mechanosensitive ion channel [Myxococcales bacterium]